jgi:hypothetical protein
MVALVPAVKANKPEPSIPPSSSPRPQARASVSRRRASKRGQDVSFH